ncbi:unnamed protein product [Rhizoctonia solani]|uniref:Uncharacterized protein n=1 Tax=Rhizoctonia solani TaxID=456999 RepID=A0A8H3HT88_9AGAM|nr:unnamed protein product [Rhizoctonia solani]
MSQLPWASFPTRIVKDPNQHTNAFTIKHQACQLGRGGWDYRAGQRHDSWKLSGSEMSSSVAHCQRAKVWQNSCGKSNLRVVFRSWPRENEGRVIELVRGRHWMGAVSEAPDRV